MKRIVLLLAFSITFASYSQEKKQVPKTPTFNIFAGGGVNWIHNDYYDTKSKPGMDVYFGGSLLLVENPIFSVHTQVNMQFFNGESELHSKEVIYQVNQNVFTFQSALYMKFDNFKLQPKIGILASQRIYDSYYYKIYVNNTEIYNNNSRGSTFRNVQIGLLLGFETKLTHRFIYEFGGQFVANKNLVYSFNTGIRYTL